MTPGGHPFACLHESLWLSLWCVCSWYLPVNTHRCVWSIRRFLHWHSRGDVPASCVYVIREEGDSDITGFPLHSRTREPVRQRTYSRAAADVSLVFAFSHGALAEPLFRRLVVR